jgi:DNA-binding NarL/FixJ family response regulator
LKTITRIAVVEDHNFYRNGLCLALKRIKNVELAYDVSNGMDFLEKQRTDPVDVVFIDVMMPVMNGYDTVLIAKREFPELKIIILTMLEEEESVGRFIQAGVQGYLLKNIDHQGLEKAINAVINGRSYFSEELMSYFTKMIREKDNPEVPKTTLTKRELEILQLIYNGMSNKEIAEKLFISLRTVTNHRYNLNLKLSVKNTAGLIAYALKNNLVK